jgi:hypothetical protein
MGDQLVTWPILTEYTETSVLGVGFEPKIPVFERTETVCGLDRGALSSAEQMRVTPSMLRGQERVAQWVQ